MIREVLEPRVTLIGKPLFVEPAHLPVAWEGEGSDGARLAEFSGRMCYMSQGNPADRTTQEYVDNIKRLAHGSVLEHANYSLLIEGISRSLSHEFVRHRAGFAYSQLSQRYVDESNVEFVVPPAVLEGAQEQRDTWRTVCTVTLHGYSVLTDSLIAQYAHIEQGTERRKKAREAARSLLPNAAETKLVATGNGRSWRHWLEMRGGAGADREMQRLAPHVYRTLLEAAPEFFSDYRADAYFATPFEKV